MALGPSRPGAQAQLAASAAALTRARLGIAVAQVADLASGSFVPAISESAGDAPSPPLPAAAAHRTSPPAPLLCQVPSCGLDLEGMRSYNKRSRCAAHRTGLQRVRTSDGSCLLLGPLS